MEDTLRYFFSAVFQGFAAIITLGIMFYLYFIDKLRSRTNEIKNNLLVYKPSQTGDDLYKYLEEEGIIKYMKNKLLPIKKDFPSYNNARNLVSLYDSIEAQKGSLSERLKDLFKIARVILITSLISLFCVGYHLWINYALIGFGIFCIVLAIMFFSDLYTFSKEIIDTPL